MKVTKSAVYKLEITSDCGCKVAGEYKDEVHKQQVGESVFAPCEKHKPMEAEFGPFMREVLDKEAKDSQAPPPPPQPEAMHPRTAARMATMATSAPAEGGEEAPNQAPDQPTNVRVVPPSSNAGTGPIRTLRTSGNNGSAGRPAAPPPQASSGTHRPAPRPVSGGGGSGRSPFRRAESGAAALSSHAQAALAKTSSVGGPSNIRLDIGEEVPEDRRVTALIEDLGLCNDPNDPDAGDDILGDDD